MLIAYPDCQTGPATGQPFSDSSGMGAILGARRRPRMQRQRLRPPQRKGHRLVKPARLATLVLLLPLAFAACGGSASIAPSAAPSGAPSAAPSTAPSAEPAAATPGASPSAAAGKVSANTATQAELAAAFSAAGIPNADRWAREVTEYRPYPTDDPTWGQLRQELGKYNIDPATLEQIIALLEP
jgi:hypothetical protein